jgi:hypothetical protein
VGVFGGGGKVYRVVVVNVCEVRAMVGKYQHSRIEMKGVTV